MGASRVLGVPDLPPLDTVSTWAVGPHPTCNWLLPGRLIAGSYPGARGEPEHSTQIRACLDGGRTDVFVCLQERYELTTRFAPYISIAGGLYADIMEAKKANDSGKKDELDTHDEDTKELEFYHCPIPDTHVTSKGQIDIAIATIAAKLTEGRNVYVHCWGGHGRTGTVLCAFLMKVYGLTAAQAKQYYGACHIHRIRKDSRPWSLAGQHQINQVSEFEGEDATLTKERLPPLEDWTLGRADFDHRTLLPRSDVVRSNICG